MRIKDYRIIFKFTGECEKIELYPGRWKFELWGAGSGKSKYKEDSLETGKGAYVKGELLLNKEETFYCCVGGRGGDNVNGNGGTAGFNGGAPGADDTGNPDDLDDKGSFDCGSGGGGGASDVRLKQEDLYSRIIVAGGGGSPGCYNAKSGIGGSGGTLNGIDGGPREDQSETIGKGGFISESSLFGNGTMGEKGNEAAGSGGGGYFAGYGGKYDIDDNQGAGGGGGGSSYVSGCDGCRTLLPYNELGDKIYPSFLIFENITMIAGNESFIPQVSYECINYKPHEDDGLIIITNLINLMTAPQKLSKTLLRSLFKCIVISLYTKP